MTDVERRLQDALRSVGANYRAADEVAARSRFIARRRRRVGLYGGSVVLASAAAAFAFVVLSPQEATKESDDRLPVVGPTVEAVVADRVEVGDAPSGVGAGGGFLWVANFGDDTVSKIDPATNKVVQNYSVAGGPEDVLVSDGFVWVATQGGEVVAIQPDTGEQHSFPGAFQPEAHFDLASAGEGGVWVSQGGGSLLRLDVDADPTVSSNSHGAWDLRDVSSNGSNLWAYDQGSGEVLHMDSSGRVVHNTPVGVSINADLKATNGFTWLLLGDSGTLVQIAQDTGEIVSRSKLGGEFGAIAEEGGVLYVMVTEGGEPGSVEGRLYLLDANSGKEIGNPVPLSDSPHDVEAGPSGVWITNNSSDMVTRVELLPSNEVPADEGTPAVAGEVLFYFARGGDIFSYDTNGTIVPVISSRAFETSPSAAPNGTSLIYQRGRSGSRRSQVVGHHLFEGTEIYPIDRGEAPAFSSEGRIAWTWLNGSGGRMISVGTPGTGDRTDFDADPERAPRPSTVDGIVWDAAGDTIMFESSSEGAGLYMADVGSDVVTPHATAIPTNEEGAVYLSPAVHDDGAVTVVRLCCGSYPEFKFSVAELGRLEGDAYTKIAGLDDLGLRPSFDLWIESAGRLGYEAESGWRVEAARSWLVGDGDRLGLISESGEFDEIELSGVTHAAVVPDPLE